MNINEIMSAAYDSPHKIYQQICYIKALTRDHEDGIPYMIACLNYVYIDYEIEEFEKEMKGSFKYLLEPPVPFTIV